MCRKTDYPELQKYPVTLTTKKGEVIECLVVDANYHVGITIVAANDHKRELICLNRQEFAGYRAKGGISTRLPNWKRAYSLMFYFLIASIKAGHLIKVHATYRDILKDACNFTGGTSGGAPTCAWR